ncbi:MAG: cupin domain-containing protein [Eubacteriales bacterium]|nr:cupin domain-containing protein [Eubacteriales bacterium]
MEKGIITHLSRGDSKQLPGREPVWLQTPESTGGKYMSVCVCTYEPGTCVLPAHDHPHGEETGYVAFGSGKVLIGDTVYDVTEGSVFLFPQGVPHTIWNSGSEPMRIIFMYANGREAIESIPHEDIKFPGYNG